MSHEELQSYLQQQLDCIRDYQRDQCERCRRDIDLTTAIHEWAERFGAVYRRHWVARRRRETA